MTDQAPEIIPPSADGVDAPDVVLDAAAIEETTISDPAKLIRLGTMLQTLMAEVREAATDEESRRLLARIHAETMEELATVLSPDLMDELTEFTDCCDSDGVPTEAEIRVAQAQLVGWLQGLLQGLQASMAQQQAVAAMQFQQMQAARQQAAQQGANRRPGQGLPDQTGTYL